MINSLSLTHWHSRLFLKQALMWFVLAFALMTTAAYIHVQQHELQQLVSKQHLAGDSGQCQLCVSSFSFSAFLLTHAVAFQLPQAHYLFSNEPIIFFQPLRLFSLTNRGPPQSFSIIF
jgi:hypothetical protein